MSVRVSKFYKGKWHVFETGRHGSEGLFVRADSFSGNAEDGDGYADFELNQEPVAADWQVFLPREVCDAIAKWVASEKECGR